MVGLTLSVSLSVSLTLSSLSSRLPTEQHAQILWFHIEGLAGARLGPCH
jgi:hypothetical protein